jgi:hypothetical protein
LPFVGGSREDKVTEHRQFGPTRMKRLALVALLAVSQLGSVAAAEEHGRIKKKPPTPAEAERIASDMVMNDGSLQKGDIVSTDLYRGLGPDGYSSDFVRVPNPLPSSR